MLLHELRILLGLIAFVTLVVTCRFTIDIPRLSLMGWTYKSTFPMQSRVVSYDALPPSSMLRPPLSRLLDNTNVAKIVGDVQFLLDFAIIGHPKCATTFLNEWLASHDEIQMYHYELLGLNRHRPDQLVQDLYGLPFGRRGMKNPRDILHAHALDYLRQYWPRTRLIVGVRHPVWWFESFYNFRLTHNTSMPAPNSTLLMGECRKELYSVCTDETLFHQHLSFLGKTAMNTSEEMSWLGNFSRPRPLLPLPNKVFLYETNQLSDTNTSRAWRFRHDLSNYLGLNQTLSEIVRPTPLLPKRKVLNICHELYRPLRAILMTNARAASLWMRKYFMDHDDVVVSSPDFFREILQAWMVDPCETVVT